MCKHKKGNIFFTPKTSFISQTKTTKPFAANVHLYSCPIVCLTSTFTLYNDLVYYPHRVKRLKAYKFCKVALRPSAVLLQLTATCETGHNLKTSFWNGGRSEYWHFQWIKRSYGWNISPALEMTEIIMCLDWWGTSNISPLQVRSQLRKIKARKAAYPDKISSWLLRTCSDQLCDVVQHVFNLSLKQLSPSTVENILPGPSAQDPPTGRISMATGWWHQGLTQWKPWRDSSSSTCSHSWAHLWNRCSLPSSPASTWRMPSSISSTHRCHTWRRLGALWESCSSISRVPSTPSSSSCWETSCSMPEWTTTSPHGLQITSQTSHSMWRHRAMSQTCFSAGPGHHRELSWLHSCLPSTPRT